MREHIIAICLITFKTIGYFNRRAFSSRGSYIIRLCFPRKYNHRVHTDTCLVMVMDAVLVGRGEWGTAAEIRPLQPSYVLSITRVIFSCYCCNDWYWYILIYSILFDKMGVNHITCRYLTSAFDPWSIETGNTFCKEAVPWFPPAHFGRRVMVTKLIALIREGFYVRTIKWTQRIY